MIEGPRPKYSRLLLGSSALILASCAALAPSWIVTLEDDLKYKTYLYPSSDETTFFRFGHNGIGKHASIEEFDLEGHQLNSLSLPDIQSNRSYRTTELSNNALFISAKNLEEVLYINPTESTFWLGASVDVLTDEQSLEITSAFANEQDQLVFVANLYETATPNYDTPFIKVIGTVSQDGDVSPLVSFPNAANLRLHKIKGSDDLIANGDHTLEFEQVSGKHTFLHRLDHNFNMLEENQFEQHLYVRNVSDNKLQAFLRADNAEIYGEFDLSGQLIQNYEGRPTSWYLSTLWGEFVYYEVRQLPGDGFIKLTPTSFEVCQYNMDFENTWCQYSDEYLDFEGMRKQITSGDELGLSYRSSETKVLGADFQVESIDANVLANFDLKGQYRLQIHHERFDINGQKTLNAKEVPYYHTGPFRLSYFFGLEVVEESVHSGVSQLKNSLFLSDNKLISDSSFTEDNDRTNASRLTMWEWE